MLPTGTRRRPSLPVTPTDCDPWAFSFSAAGATVELGGGIRVRHVVAGEISSLWPDALRLMPVRGDLALLPGAHQLVKGARQLFVSVVAGAVRPAPAVVHDLRQPGRSAVDQQRRGVTLAKDLGQVRRLDGCPRRRAPLPVPLTRLIGRAAEVAPQPAGPARPPAAAQPAGTFPTGCHRGRGSAGQAGAVRRR